MGQAQGIAPTGRPALGDTVGAFKSIVTDEYVEGVHSRGWRPFPKKLLHRNYWEHIIRNEREWFAISEHIRNNPSKRESDRDNLRNVRHLAPPRCIHDYLDDLDVSSRD